MFHWTLLSTRYVRHYQCFLPCGAFLLVNYHHSKWCLLVQNYLELSLCEIQLFVPTDF